MIDKYDDMGFIRHAEVRGVKEQIKEGHELR